MSKKDKKDVDFTNIKKDNPFDVPENYFADFQKSLISKISESKPEASNTTTKILRLVKSQLGLAASILLFAGISYVSLNFLLTSPTIKKDSIQYSEIIENDISNYDEEQILEFYQDIETETDESVQDQTSTNIIDYLVEENIDIELIIEEL